MAGIVMDTATFAHPNATPRTLVVSAALVEAGAPLSDISRRLYRTKPDAQLRLFGVVLDRLETADDGRIVWSSLTDADLAATGAERAHSEGIIDLLSQAEAAEVAILFKEAGTATRVSVRTKPGGVDATVLTGAFGGGGHARAAGASVDAPLADARPLRPRRGDPARRRAGALTMARSSLGPGLDGILVVAKPAGPTSHDVVALVRRLAATKRVGHGGTLDPFASGVLPVFLGHATRVVEYHLGDRKAYRATVCFGASSTTDDLEGELTPAADGTGADARGGRGGTPRADRHDLAAAAGLQRDQGRRPARLRHGPGRRDGPAADRARSRSTPSTSCRGTAPTRTARSPILDVDVLGGHVRPRARRATSARPSGAPPTSAR